MQPNGYNIIFENLSSWGIKSMWLIIGFCLISVFLNLFWLLCILIYTGNKSKKDP